MSTKPDREYNPDLQERREQRVTRLGAMQQSGLVEVECRLVAWEGSARRLRRRAPSVGGREDALRLVESAGRPPRLRHGVKWQIPSPPRRKVG